MAKKKSADQNATTDGSNKDILRAPAEELFSEEIEALIKNDSVAGRIGASLFDCICKYVPAKND